MTKVNTKNMGKLRVIFFTIFPVKAAFVLRNSHAIMLFEDAADVVNIGHAYMFSCLSQRITVATNQNCHIGKLTAVNILQKGNAFASAKYIGHVIFTDTYSLGNLGNSDVAVNIFRNKREAVVNIETKVKPQTKEKVSFAHKFMSALKYGYVEMMQDIGKYLIIGLVVAGIITVAVPNEFFALFAANSLLSMLLVLLFALPMYLCATGSIPIAVALMLKGLSPGAALVLLMAGPAVNFASMLVVGKVLGKKTLFIYLLSVVLGSFLCGLAIDYLLPREWFVMPWTQMQSVVEHSHSFLSFNSLCTLVMIGLLVNAFVRKHRHGHSHSDCGCSSCTDSCSDEKSSCECSGNKSECTCANGTCSTSETKMQEFKVEGMRCNHCKANVEKAVSSIQGVESVEVSLEDKIVLVKGNFTSDEVKKAIEELGFRLM